MANKSKKRPLTPEEKLLRGYQRKLTVEAVIKSLVLGLIAGFLLCILVSIISFATKYNTLWIALGVWVAATAGLTVLFYFKVFRTTLDKTASRVDGMGLDERVITMIEFADSDNVMAKMQRQDTAAILQSVTPKRMKFAKTKIFIVFASILAAIACTAILMMTFSTVKAEEYKERPVQEEEEEEELTEEDLIIKEMLEDLRKIIEDAKIKEDLRAKLNGMVDDLEESLKSTSSTDWKIAKIIDTKEKIEEILRDTIPYELQKYETTEKLGAALDTEDIQVIEDAFIEMYDSITVLAGQQKYDRLKQTAEDILQSIDDAQVVDDDLAEALEKLAEAFLAAIPPPPEEGGEEDRSDDEVDQAVQDAIQDAMDAIKDAMDSIKDNNAEIDNVDQAIQDAMQDAMDSLGQQDSEKDPEEDEKEEEGDREDEGDAVGPSHPSEDGELVFDTVIDGNTPYIDVYDEYYQKALELLANGNLTDEERQIIENYIGLLNQNKGE